MLKPKNNIILAFILIALIFPAIFFIIGSSIREKNFYFTSTCILIYSFIPFFLFFENKKSQLKSLSLIAVMSAIAVVSRIAFYFIPQFKPITAIIIITGIALGAEAGFISGSLSALVSNFLFGQGPWTPWQMFCLGIVGFLSGIIFKTLCIKINKFTLSLWSLISTMVIYSGIINISSFLLYYDIKTIDAFTAYYILSLPFDLLHSASTILFLLILYKPLLFSLDRIKRKYNI